MRYWQYGVFSVSSCALYEELIRHGSECIFVWGIWNKYMPISNCLTKQTMVTL